MATVLDYKQIKNEIVNGLRNADVFTITQRGVTTVADTGTFAADSTHLINRTNIKNIRSIVVASVTLTYGTDYTYDMDFDDSGTIKTKITFTSPQTGAYTITYDYGTDKIYPELPRTDMNISSFPRLGVSMIGENQDDNELSGASKISNISLTIIAYAKKTDDVEDILKAVRTWVLGNQTSLYYTRYIRKIAVGPLLPFPTTSKKVMMRNTDFLTEFNIEQI